MWDFFRIGPVEIAVVLFVVAALWFRHVRRRWLPLVLPCLLIAAVMSPADPISMLLIAASLTAVVTVCASVLRRRRAA